jgi:succinate dehydrogenase / fumarate reductase cytochrome b subunit
MENKRPKNLNLFTIRLPFPAMVSILHRISGVILFILMPLLTIALYFSVQSESFFLHIYQFFYDSTLFKAFKLLMIWGIIHHLIAGTRHILLDLHFGIDLIIARFTSKIVLLLSFLISFIVWVWVW